MGSVPGRYILQTPGDTQRLLDTLTCLDTHRVASDCRPCRSCTIPTRLYREFTGPGQYQDRELGGWTGTWGGEAGHCHPSASSSASLLVTQNLVCCRDSWHVAHQQHAVASGSSSPSDRALPLLPLQIVLGQTVDAQLKQLLHLQEAEIVELLGPEKAHYEQQMHCYSSAVAALLHSCKSEEPPHTPRLAAPKHTHTSDISHQLLTGSHKTVTRLQMRQR